jgi:acetyl-CoA carboxylase / biotin carboxylase 1
VIKDIIGQPAEKDLGVENLRGSGTIAGETSTAYNDIFTLTVRLRRASDAYRLKIASPK